MVDLSKLKAGDTVKFRCGGEGIINKSEPSEKYKDGIWLQFKGFETGLSFKENGKPFSNTDHDGPHIFDITEIIPKPFDWSEVKPGDQFYYTNSTALGLLSFVALHPTLKDIAICINEAATDKHPRNVSLYDMEPVND